MPDVRSRESRVQTRGAHVLGIDAALVAHAARTPEAVALVDAERSTSYAALADEVVRVARTFARLGVRPGKRVAVIATKRVGTVSALFGAMRLGAVGVPINPLLKPDQVLHILADSGAHVLVGPQEVLTSIEPHVVTGYPSLAHLIAIEDTVGSPAPEARRSPLPASEPIAAREPDTTPALILYTSGSTARPKGVVLSHSNLAHGAASVAGYLENEPDDRILALMPLSFDYGLSQVLTALQVGARAILFDYLVPRGVVAAVTRHRITGLPAVPHLWNQLARLDWSPVEHLRYVTNTGGRMPVETTRGLVRKLPDTRIVLMYGFTEAFRSTWLPPEEVTRRPGSIGKAVPYARVFVVDEQGRECAPGEIGELIHGGPLVAQGYWNDETATRAKFRPRFPAERGSGTAVGSGDGGERTETTAATERFAWSGDLARTDSEGYLYFVSRREDLAKLHGFRVNPAEIEEAIGRSSLVREVSVICVPHPVLGQAAIAVLVADEGDVEAIGRHCRQTLPRFMQPERLVVVAALPAGPNNKIDRQALRDAYGELFSAVPDRDGDTP